MPEQEGMAIGHYEPAFDYLHPEMQPVVDKLFDEGLREEAIEMLEISTEYAQRLKYAARLVGHEITRREVDID